MISIHALIKNPIYNKEICGLEGCIVFIDGQLYLIDSNDANNYPNITSKIKVNNNIKQILLKSVALYSGVTSLFHDVEVTGYVLNNNPGNDLSIDLCNLKIKDGQNWKRIDISNTPENGFIEENPTPDWNDLFK